jgi:UDP-N-acetylmuramyl pentapeptide phosphotransferase/UDP-N-acetylglucosamine-1-phosphate transferase
VPEFFVTVFATVLALRALHDWLGRIGLIDVPNHRSSHDRPVARGGGLGCLVGVAVGLATAAAWGHPVPWALVTVAAALSLVGLADDVHSLPPVPRLAAQVAAGATATALAGGEWWLFPAGALLVLLTVNVVNFVDGINGITGLVMGLWGLVACLSGVAYGSGRLIVLGAVTAGAALAFLPFNLFHPKLFLGDVGSYLFGALVAVGFLVAWRDGVDLTIVAAPLLLHVADVISTLIIRLFRRESLVIAHRDHVYQLLVARAGWSHIRTATTVAGLSLLVTLSWTGPAFVAALFSGAVVCVYLALRPWASSRVPPIVQAAGSLT